MRTVLGDIHIVTYVRPYLCYQTTVVMGVYSKGQYQNLISFSLSTEITTNVKFLDRFHQVTDLLSVSSSKYTQNNVCQNIMFEGNENWFNYGLNPATLKYDSSDISFVYPNIKQHHHISKACSKYKQTHI